MAISATTWQDQIHQLKSAPHTDPSTVQSGRHIVVHEFVMGDVEDPDLYAGASLWDFEKSEKGQWVMTHALETPVWQRQVRHVRWGYRYVISARFTESNITYFLLRFK